MFDPRTYHEFFCFIHLITSVTRGARMPSLQEGLPPQLLESLMNLEPLEVLVAEREEFHLQTWQDFCFSSDSSRRSKG